MSIWPANLPVLASSLLFQNSTMSVRKYRLIYFDARGMGEPIRYMFIHAGVEYENISIKFKDWPQVKPTTPFGQVPVLEFDGRKVGQSVAICRFLASEFGLLPEDAIGRLYADVIAGAIIDLRAPEISMFGAYLCGDTDKLREIAVKYETEQFITGMSNLEEFLPDSDYLTGNKVTWVDLYVAAMLEFLVDAGKTLGYKASLSAYPKLAAIQTKVFGSQRIAKFRASRQVGEFDM